MDPLSTVEKAADVLFHLHACAEPQGVTAIGRALGLPKSSTHRLLAALGRRGLVERSDRGLYRTGAALIALGLGALTREPIVELARAVLEQTAAEVGETIFLVAARSQQLVVIDKVEGSGFLRVSPQVGELVPVHATAVGKLYLAFDPDRVRVEPQPESFTQRTTTSVEALASEVAAVRAAGIASNEEEWVSGLGVVAAPVFSKGQMVAAVALGAATARLTEIGSDEVTRYLLAAASRIEARLAADVAEFASTQD
ncbi:MAG: IclR family acetate operon transcriptional repressor [Myxococcota bacterium]|jgi:IclR family acetate operon transcriptional repressor